MRNNNNNERSGNSSAKKGKNKSGGSTSNNNDNNNNDNNYNNNNSDKPKQPQRGLGVAQLEKIRLHTQMASCGILPHPFFTSPFQEEMMRYQAGYQGIPLPPPYDYSSPTVPSSVNGYQHPNAFMMGMGDHMERQTKMGYSESQPCNTASWNPNNFRATRESQPYTPQSGMVTRHLLSHVERQSRWNKMFESKDSNSQNSETSDTGELDLDLKL